MSIRDSLIILSEEQALTATADSEDVIDLGAGYDAWGAVVAAPELGEGRPLWLNVMVSKTLASAGKAATLTVKFMTGTADTCTTTVFSTAALAEAVLVAGYCIASVPLPMGLNRYIKLTYTVGVENFTSGAVSAWIGFEPYKAA